MRLMKEPRGRPFSWYSYFSNYPLFLVLRVAVKRLQSKITQNTKKQTNSRKSRTGLHKTGARTEGGHGSHGSPKRRVKPVTHIRLASVGEENICGGVVRGIGSTDIRIRSRGVLYSSTSTVVSTRSLLPVNMSRVAAEKTGVSRQVRVCQHCRGCEGCGSVGNHRLPSIQLLTRRSRHR